MAKEYIEREAALKKSHLMMIGNYIGEFVGVDDIKKIPSADVVEVVRCKDCRYFFCGHCLHPSNRVTTMVPDFGEHYSFKSDLRVSENHYCGYRAGRVTL